MEHILNNQSDEISGIGFTGHPCNQPSLCLLSRQVAMVAKIKIKQKKMIQVSTK